MATLTVRGLTNIDKLDEELLFFTKMDLDEMCDQIMSSTNKVRYEAQCRKLYQAMTQIGIECEMDVSRDAASYYMERIQQHFSDPDGGDETENSLKKFTEHLVAVLSAKLDAFPTPIQAMKRIVDALGDPAWRSDSLRLRIAKQLVREGDFLNAAFTDNQKAWLCGVYGIDPKHERAAEMAADAMKEDVFTLYENGSPKPKCEALRLADALATGRFWLTCQNTKGLYLFAICFHLTFSYHSEKALMVMDEKRDISRNLFCGFFAPHAENDLQNGSVIPVERGINFSNFAEMCYLWAITRDDEQKPPVDKIVLAETMLKDVMKEEDTSDIVDGSGTQFYCDTLVHLLDLEDQSEAVSFIQRYYVISRRLNPNRMVAQNKRDIKDKITALLKDGAGPDVIAKELETYTGDQVRERLAGLLQQRKNETGKLTVKDVWQRIIFVSGGKVSPFSVRASQETAREVFAEVSSELGKVLRELEHGDDEEVLDSFCGKGFRNLTAQEKEWLFEKHPDAKEIANRLSRPVSIPDFQFSLKRLTDAAEAAHKEQLLACLKNTERLLDSIPARKAPKMISRSVLLAKLMYLYIYREYLAFTKMEKEAELSFKKVFNNFAEFADPALQASYYAPLNGKYIFDILAAAIILLSCHDSFEGLLELYEEEQENEK